MNNEKLNSACFRWMLGEVTLKDLQKEFNFSHTEYVRRLLKKGGAYKFNVAQAQTEIKGYGKYKRWVENLTIAESPRWNNKTGETEVLCTYCGRYYVPSITSVSQRMACLRGSYGLGSECRLYCSDGCKASCTIFYSQGIKGIGKSIIDGKNSTSREMQPELRKMVLERDEYKCTKCGVSIKDKTLHCHHIKQVATDPIESADVDNCISLCIDCHHLEHKINGNKRTCWK